MLDRLMQHGIGVGGGGRILRAYKVVFFAEFLQLLKFQYQYPQWIPINQLSY